MKKILTYISLFSSAGVGCYGFKQNGFECVATSEIIPRRLDIQKYNQKCKYNSGYISGDITSGNVKKALFKEVDKWKKQLKISEPDVIIATPPCQGMSIANHKKNNELGRNSLVVESIAITKKINPKFFIFENVRGFLNTTCTDIDGAERKIGQAINLNLGGKYNILSRIVNFKDYGSNSSRTRTLVIGVRKDLPNICPYDIFPSSVEPVTLRTLFKDLEPLNKMGQSSVTDIYHSFRTYDKRMTPWIENLKEGESAFDNTDVSRIPHRIIDGEIVFNQNKNGDKYSRWFWDREGPCIHTRNDILSSQNTIHPSENRVFSIRELMLMMSIPHSFKWIDTKISELNGLAVKDKKAFFKKEELNIRQCIGEAVPTKVFASIADKIKRVLEKKVLTMPEVHTLIQENELGESNNLISFIDERFDEFGIDNIFQIAEHANSFRLENSAFFTRKDIAYTVVKDLPNFEKKDVLRILEPSVGVGNFIPLLLEKYEDKREVYFDVVDIDGSSILVLQKIIEKLKLSPKYHFNFITADFLTHNLESKYDLVVGNPPYMKVSNNKTLLDKYKSNAFNTKTNNLFSFFIEKAIQVGDYVSFIVPKSLVNAPEFDKTRELFDNGSCDLLKICDYGEKGFRGVKIETISFLLKTICDKNLTTSILIESYINESIEIKDKAYIFDSTYPYWLLYRDSEFDAVAQKMKFDVFESFRDRQITKKITRDSGKYRVLKSRNIQSNTVIELEDYDCYVDDIEDLAVAKYLNRKNVVLVPNLTYYPRATFLPKNAISDGSVAMLTLKNGSRLPTKEDLAFYGTKEYETFYRIARNYGTRSLNIDNNSVYFFGLLKDKYK